MFNKRLVFFAGNEKPAEQPKTPAELARDRMKQMMPPDADQLQTGDKVKEGKVETKEVNNTMEVEARQTNDMTRADIISILKEGQKMNPNTPPAGVDAALYRDIVKDLRGKLPQGQGDHFSTHWESLTGGDTNFYFMSVYDSANKPPVRFFFKKGDDFSIKDKTFLRDVDDGQYVALTGQPRKKEEPNKKA